MSQPRCAPRRLGWAGGVAELPQLGEQDDVCAPSGRLATDALALPQRELGMGAAAASLHESDPQ
jgi:hypothetical protein